MPCSVTYTIELSGENARWLGIRGAGNRFANVMPAVSYTSTWLRASPVTTSHLPSGLKPR